MIFAVEQKGEKMTKKEAIDILKNTIVRFGRTNCKTAYAEALQMAIKALEHPEIIRCGECVHKDKKIDYCHHLGITICECDYCSFAERQEE